MPATAWEKVGSGFGVKGQPSCVQCSGVGVVPCKPDLVRDTASEMRHSVLPFICCASVQVLYRM